MTREEAVKLYRKTKDLWDIAEDYAQDGHEDEADNAADEALEIEAKLRDAGYPPEDLEGCG